MWASITARFGYTPSVVDESAGPVGTEELSSVASSQTSGTRPSGHGTDTRSKSRKRERESQDQRKKAKTAETQPRDGEPHPLEEKLKSWPPWTGE